MRPNQEIPIVGEVHERSANERATSYICFDLSIKYDYLCMHACVCARYE